MTHAATPDAPVILFDPWPRSADLIFGADMRARFAALGTIVGLAESAGGKLPAEFVDAHLAQAVAIVGQTDLDAQRIARAPCLRTVINVEGNFGQNVDYAACFARGIQVLGVAPVFAQPVAEMALGMAIDLARGITRGDRLMRAGHEQYGLAGVTAQNQGWLNRARLSTIRSDAVFLLLSRAGIVDFDALVDLVAQGRFRAATDVFPVEPAPADLPARQVDDLLLSAHRAGGLPSALAAIGELVVDDLGLILAGLPPQRLQAARRETVGLWRNPPGRSYAPGTRL